MDSGEREMNPVAMTSINSRKEYWPSQGSNQRPPVLKSAKLPTQLRGSAKVDLGKAGICAGFSTDGFNQVMFIQCWAYTELLVGFSVYLSSLPVSHLSNAPRRWLVVTGDSARIQDETTENSAWFFNVLGV